MRAQHKPQDGGEQNARFDRGPAHRKRGTGDALFNIRRVIDIMEQTQEKTLLVLLDWEKAFDKITHSSLVKTLERFNLPEKLIKVIGAMYRTPQFCCTERGDR